MKIPRGDALLLLFAVLFSITHHLSRHSAAAAAADFEGFDSDDLESDYEEDYRSQPFLTPSPPLATLTEISPKPDPPPPTPPPAPSPPPPIDIWDEDEFEGIPLQPFDPIPSPQSPPSNASDPFPPPVRSSSYLVEISSVVFLIAYAANYFIGLRHNERIALSFASRFAGKGSILDKNFIPLSTGDDQNPTPLLLKERRDLFKFFAGGRRPCRGLLATVELRARHDLISRVTDVLLARKDTVTFEVIMNEDAMDQVVFALVRRKAGKRMQKVAGDLRRFANVVAVPPSARRWVDEELVVISESKEVAGDLITDVVLDQVFGETAFEKFGKWFISLHFSDQHPASFKKMLFFKFALPDSKNMADISRLVALVPYYTDLVGRYKLSPQTRSKTEAARAKAAQEAYKELQSVRQEVLQKKKIVRKKLMEEAEAMLTAEVIRKREEKENSRQLKNSMPRVKMLHSN